MTLRLPRLLVPLLAAAAFAAGATERTNTFSTRGFAEAPGHRSPVVHADGRISFALHAPAAREVVVRLGEWQVVTQSLTRDDAGWWTGTLGPLAPGLHTYAFVVDGLTLVDPLNPRLKTGTVVYGNTVEVPADPPRFDAFQNVPQGATHILRYRSSPLHRDKTLHLYLPAAYASEPARRFPVLYLRHGGGDDDHNWLQDGRAGAILDNLLARGAAEPMIIVMTDGMTDGTWSHGSSAEGLRLLERELMEDVVPLVERSYRVMPDREHRALAGLSMGGGQAFVIGLRNLDSFAWIAQFSSGLLADRELRLTEIAPALRDADRVNAALRLLWIGCGTDDTRYAGHLDLVDSLHALGIRTEFRSSPGGHEWSVWREQLHALLPVLFRASAD